MKNRTNFRVNCATKLKSEKIHTIRTSSTIPKSIRNGLTKLIRDLFLCHKKGKKIVCHNVTQKICDKIQFLNKKHSYTFLEMQFFYLYTTHISHFSTVHFFYFKFYKNLQKK